MDFVLIDYQPRGKQINRDQTGTFGSHFHAGGIVGKALSKLKAYGIRLPVLSFSYAAAMLRSEGHTVRIVTDIPNRGGDVAIFATVMYHWKEDLRFLREYKKLHPATKLGVIGAFSQVMPELFSEVCDFVIGGEIEAALFAFFDGKWNWQGRFSADSPVDLSRLPLPDWNGFPVSDYSYYPVLPRKNFLPVQTARGCAYGCNFCPYVIAQGTKMRFREPDKVEKEIYSLAREHGVRSVLFRDILFGVPTRRTEEICERIEKLNLGIEWGCEMRVDSLTDSLVDKMVSAGMRVVNLGVETPDSEILSDFGKKPSDVSFLRHIIKKLHRRNVRVQAFYVIGLLNDTPDTMRRTLRFAKGLNTFSAQFCVATPFPGTPFFEEVKGRLLHRDWSRFTEYEPVLNLSKASVEDVAKIRDLAYGTYYTRPGWLLRYGLDNVKNVFKKWRR